MCDVCDLEFQNLSVMNKHMKSRKHKDNLAILKQMMEKHDQIIHNENADVEENKVEVREEEEQLQEAVIEEVKVESNPKQNDKAKKPNNKKKKDKPKNTEIPPEDVDAKLEKFKNNNDFLNELEQLDLDDDSFGPKKQKKKKK